jgi:hypothetical protein
MNTRLFIALTLSFFLFACPVMAQKVGTNRSVVLTAEQENDDIQFTWKSNAPKGYLEYEVEYSSNGDTWEVKAAYKSNKMRDDFKLSYFSKEKDSVSYYRIKEVSETGVTVYSNILILHPTDESVSTTTN